MEKRLGIFVIYNKEGIIERYLPPLLQGLRQCCQKLLIVSNGMILPEEAEKIRHYADAFFYRENVGFDCGAIQDVLSHLYGWEKVLQYDELVIMNDTCYGPIYPLNNAFDDMAGEQCDFWGLTDCEPMQVDSGIWGVEWLPYHVQSYFIVFRRNLLHSNCFRDFWNEMKLSDDYYETIKNYELSLTKHFHDNGYKSSTYVQRKEKIPYCYVRYEPYQLVKYHKIPLIKRKLQFFCLEESIPFFSSYERARLLEYLQKENLYDTGMILEDIRHRSNDDACRLSDPKPEIKELYDFCDRSQKVLIYGAGAYAQMVANTFSMEGIAFDGFLVSDGHKKETQKCGKTVFELSEINSDEKKSMGVVLGLENKYHSAVIDALHGQKVNHIFAI